MNSDTFYVLISGNRGKGCKCVNFVSSWSFCTKRFGETSGADLGGHWRSQLTKTSDLGWSKSSFLPWNWSVLSFFRSPYLLDDQVKFQPDSNDKFDILGSIPAAEHPIRPGQKSKNVSEELLKISILVFFWLLKTTDAFKWLVKVAAQLVWLIFVTRTYLASKLPIRTGQMSKNLLREAA